MSSHLRRCSSLKLKSRSRDLSFLFASLRERRTTVFAWLISGFLAMYFEAIAIAAELRDYPGGAVALSKSIMPTIEGMRIIRWPADRLDTLGGYLAYHNIVLFNYFLALFAATQGARLIRHLEENQNVNLYLSTGLSRSRMMNIRVLSYFLSQILISLGLGAGTAFALAASNEPNTQGALITLLAGGICIFPFFALGVFISQFVISSRNATGIAAIFVTTIYLLDNISGKYGWLHWVSYLSPFHYANLTRPVIPGFGSNYWSWLMMVFVGLLIIQASIYLLSKRDIGAKSLGRVERVKVKKISSVKSKLSYAPKSVVGDLLWRQRYGLMAWVITSAAFIALFISMMSGIIDIWEKFAFLQQFSASGFGDTPEQQYLAMVYEVMPPFLAAYLLMQSSKWSNDLGQGRVQLFLATPLSWSGLILRRFLAAFLGAQLLIVSSILVVIVGSKIQGVDVYSDAVIRVYVMANLFVLAFSGINALIVSIMRAKNVSIVLSIYVGAAWMIGFMAPYLKWPHWLVRLSIFDAFGHPFIAWPAELNFILILLMTLGGVGVAMAISERSSKVI